MKNPGALTWQLVHATPASLVYAVPAAEVPANPLIRRTARSWAGGHALGGSFASQSASYPGGLVHNPALGYARYIGRFELLAAALGVGAAVASTSGTAPIDSTAAVVSATASVPGSPLGGVAISPDGTRAYQSTTTYNRHPQLRTSVSVIRPDNTVTALPRISGYQVGGLVVSPDGTRVYQTTTDTGTGQILVSVIHSDNTIATLTRISGYAIRGVVVSPDGNHAYQTTATASQTLVSVINADNSITTLRHAAAAGQRRRRQSRRHPRLPNHHWLCLRYWLRDVGVGDPT